MTFQIWQNYLALVGFLPELDFCPSQQCLSLHLLCFHVASLHNELKSTRTQLTNNSHRTTERQQTKRVVEHSAAMEQRQWKGQQLSHQRLEFPQPRTRWIRNLLVEVVFTETKHRNQRNSALNNIHCYTQTLVTTSHSSSDHTKGALPHQSHGRLSCGTALPC